MPEQPTSSPARNAISTNAEGGTVTTPPMVWSASQRWVRSESLPVNSTSLWEATWTAVPSSGCPVVPVPASVASGSIQWRRRWKG